MFIVESIAILYVLYSGLFAVRGSGVAIAMIVVMAEVVVFVANGTRCPLTKLTRRLGDKSGNDFIGDLLPERFSRHIPLVCGGLALVGVLLVVMRLLVN